MAVKKCCIKKCKSCSTRREDEGVTFHKYPKVVALRNTWKSLTRYKDNNSDTVPYVCSRHFCKNDFKEYKDSKYILMSDAVPTIFPWSNANVLNRKMNKLKQDDDEQNESDQVTNKEAKCPDSQQTLDHIEYVTEYDKTPDHPKKGKIKVLLACTSALSSTLAMTSEAMDVILREPDHNIDEEHENLKVLRKEDCGSMSLSVGSKVEVRDFSDEWYPAEIAEVDYDEMEVLVHYDSIWKKHDEWINVSSPRLRPSKMKANIKQSPPPTPPPSSSIIEEVVPKNTPVEEDVKETKAEDKTKSLYVVGERCLARWRDNRRFIATITNDLQNGNYEIVFDDGFQWKCNISRLRKYKDTSKSSELSVDTSCPSPSTSCHSPIQLGGPSNAPALSPVPTFSNHLFDPTRDYLGSKSERREMKRKLNIKEIFNIGQKRQKVKPKEAKPVEKKPKRKSLKLKPEQVDVNTDIKTDIPDAVASIIGTVATEEPVEEPTPENIVEPTVIPEENLPDAIEEKAECATETDSTEKCTINDEVKEETSEKIELFDIKPLTDVKLDKFEEVKHEEVIDRIKEVINKLEDGINQVERTATPNAEYLEPLLLVDSEPCQSEAETNTTIPVAEPRPQPIKIKLKDKTKKGRVRKIQKIRMLHEKKVLIQVEKARNELQNMKKQFSGIRNKALKRHTETVQVPLPESAMAPGEWCCKWINGQPVGTVSEIEAEIKTDANKKTVLPRRSVQVEDKRLPPGWTKHMVRRSFGNSAGKWDVVLVSPENRRFHTKVDMRNYFESIKDPTLESYEKALMDFGVHLKLSRRIGWITNTPDGVSDMPVNVLPVDAIASTSPLVKRKKLNLKKKAIKVVDKEKKRRMPIKLKLHRGVFLNVADTGESGTSDTADSTSSTDAFNQAPLEDGYVYVGSLKVQIIENLLRCPAEGCYKNFRNNTLIKMHIKHYHRELRKMLGATPKVLDLASARTKKPIIEGHPRFPENKTTKVKVLKPQKREEPKLPEIPEVNTEIRIDVPSTPPKEDVPKTQDSPKLRHALINKPVKRPRVLLPVKRIEQEPINLTDTLSNDDVFEPDNIDPMPDLYNAKMPDILDFESAISTHTVTKTTERSRMFDKKRSFASVSKKPLSEDEDWSAVTSDIDTRSSFPRSGTPDSKNTDFKMAPLSSESNEGIKENNYMYNESGERIKIVHMKREEIINCHCGFREEDGLMVQCELCLCWQHALCHNIQKECEVPDKYTCSICLNPRRGRMSRRFVHDQDRLYEGLLPGGRALEPLRRAHELAGNLLRLRHALHALRVKGYVASKKDHPKLYLWAKDWDQLELNMAQEKLTSDYSDLNVMISSIDKENMPLMPLQMQTDEHEHDRYSHSRDSQYGSHSMLSGLLSSPGGTSIDLPISASELERLAKTVQEQECQRVVVPQPEAAIENGACRERLLQHILRCQALVDARLASMEAQVAELESQDPLFEDDETADACPRTKQTILMMMRDLGNMEELGNIT